MENENPVCSTLTKRLREYFTKIKSCFSHTPCNEINKIFETHLKHTVIKLILICVLLSTIYLFLHRDTIPKNIPITIQSKSIETQPKTPQIQTQARAYLITADCNSLRYNATKENIERVFLNFFNITCFLTIPLNDSRIHSGTVPVWKKFSSNLLAFTEIWIYEIPKYTKNNELEWTFIFEDDVDFVNPSQVFLKNYITVLQELMHNPEVQINQGFLYLGICGPTFPNGSQILMSTNTNNTLKSEKGYGFCLHASGITAKRAKFFWTEISSYRPNPADSSLDLQIREFSIRSNKHYYVFGSNLHFPEGTGHFGICYQDRERFFSTVA